jgi:hypothetical protein
MEESGPSLSAATIVLIGVIIVALAIWVGGMLYCEQIAQEKGYNIWVARLVSIFLPVIGPGIYWLLGMRSSSGPSNEV